MERKTNGDAAAAARIPSNQLRINHEGRRPLLSGAAPRGLVLGDGGLGIRSAAASVGIGARSARATVAGTYTNGTVRKEGIDPHSAREMRRSCSNDAESVITSGGTRIHTAGLLNGRPKSYAESFRIAQEEADEAERERQSGGSPSPAPRTWRSGNGGQAETVPRAEHDLNHASRHRPLATKTNSESPHKARIDEAGNGVSSPRRAGAGPSLQERIDEWRTQSHRGADVRRRRPSPDLADDGLGVEQLPELVPGIEDVPMRSIESPRRNILRHSSPAKDFTWQLDDDFTAGELQISDSPRIRVGQGSNLPFATRPSIIKQLQVRSPARLSEHERKNKELGRIRARESSLHNGAFVPQAGRASLTEGPQRQYPRLQEIRANEVAADKEVPPPSERSQLKTRNNGKLNEIGRLEANGPSKRALAAARLAEIRERNAMTRSAPPQAHSRGPQDHGQGQDQEESGMPVRRPKSAFETGGERVPDTPVTIFKQYGRHLDRIKAGRQETTASRGGEAVAKSEAVNEHDLLRRLARAASASASPASDAARQQRPTAAERQDAKESDKTVNGRAGPGGGGGSGAFTGSGRKSALSSTWGANSHERDEKNNNNNNNSNNKPPRASVGFTALQRTKSSESERSARSSMQSESDPTARIEAEMKLFAPGENQSERGSVRAPSPEPEGSDKEDDSSEASDDDADGQDALADATPRAQKHDFDAVPTPRVSGAFVETPVTARTTVAAPPPPPPATSAEVIKADQEAKDEEAHARDDEDKADDEVGRVKSFKEKLREQLEREEERKSALPGDAESGDAALFRHKRTVLAWRSKNEDTASEPGASGSRRGGDAAAATTTTTATAAAAANKKPPRSRSLPRKRPQLKNTAKLPSVKDDLRELQRQHNIDDSNMDDLEDVLSGRKRASSPKVEDLLQGLPVSAQDEFGQGVVAAADQVKQETPLDEDDKDDDDKDTSAGHMAIVSKMGKTLASGLTSIRDARLGIQRLESQFAHKQQEHAPPHKKSVQRAASPAPGATSPSIATTSSRHDTVPTPSHTWVALLGLIMAVLSVWYASEWAMCARYCRPVSCDPSTRCVYSWDDPSFGTALPVKLDQWATGGRGRRVANRLLEEVQDWTADVQDLLRGRSLQDVAVDELSTEQRRRHVRRLCKRGLAKPPWRRAVGPDQQAKWDAWRRSRLARERNRELRQMGYGAAWMDDENSLGGDERVW